MRKAVIATTIMLAAHMAQGATAKDSIADKPPVEMSTQEPWEFDRNDPLWQPHSQLMEGYSMWLLRQDMSQQGTQTIVETEGDPQAGRLSSVMMVSYIPIVQGKTFSLMTGSRYRMQEIEAEDPQWSTKLQKLWLWTSGQVRLGRWNLVQTTETYWKGDDEGLLDRTGRQFFTMSYAGYEFNKRWIAIALGGYDRQETTHAPKQRFVGGAQLRYQPSPAWKFLFGAPTILDFEGTLPTRTDLGFAWFIAGETSAFVQQRLSEHVNLGIHYSSEDEEGTWFKEKLAPASGKTLPFDEIRSTQRQVAMELGLWTSPQVGVNLGAAWNFGGALTLWHDGNRLPVEARTVSFLSVGARIQYLAF